MALSDTLSQAEQRLDEQRAKFDDAVASGRNRLRAVVDDAVEVAEDQVESSANMLREYASVLRTRSLEDLGRFGDVSVDAVKAATERMPEFELPTIDGLPTLEEVVTDSFDYAQELLAWNRSWTLAMIEAMRPTPAKPAKTTKKTTKKAAAAEAA